MMKAAGDSDTERFYAVRPECMNDVPKARFKPVSGKTLSARRWHAAFSQEGYLDIAKVLSRIQRGGVHPSIKGEVWEFLLGCYDPKSTFDERSQLRQLRREQYEMWKAVCQKMEPTIGSGRFITRPIITEDGQPVEDPSATSAESSGENTDSPPVRSSMFDDEVDLDERVIHWKLTLHQIGLDVVRTDRTLVFYENKNNDAKLWDILSIYAWVDKDIGYCQGMNDLCSPMMILLENEADAFWCFEHLMHRMPLLILLIPISMNLTMTAILRISKRENFRCTTSSIGVQSQLTTLSSIIKVVDPKLHEHLENLDGGEYLFAFRMLMVLFRREFSFVDSMYLWELMWAMEYNPNIFSLYQDRGTTTDPSVGMKGNNKHLKQYGKFGRKYAQTGMEDPQSALSIFLIASVLQNKNKRLMKEAKGLDDVVKILNEITGSLDAKKACNEALKLHKQYLNKTKKP